MNESSIRQTSFHKTIDSFSALKNYEDTDYFYIRTFLFEKLSSTLKLSITDQTLTFTGRLVPIKDSHPLYQEVIESNIHRQVTLPEPIEQRVIACIHTEEGTEYVLKKRRL